MSNYHMIMGKLKSQFSHLINVLNQLEIQIFEPLYDQKYFDAGHWDYVPYSVKNFLDHMHEAYTLLGEDSSKKFIDVGCGVGTKVQLASMYFDSYGIELHPDYAKAARKLCKNRKFFKYGRYQLKQKKSQIFEEDALKFDYSEYDVIYFFRPMNDDKLQTKLEERICEQAKPGAIIVPIYSISTFPDDVKWIKTPSKEIYMKTRNGTHAKKLKQKAHNLFF